MTELAAAPVPTPTDPTAPASTDLAPTLPGRYYTDAGVFAAEQERIFERTWNCVAPAADLAGPGAFRTVTVGRESVVLVRGRDGAVRGFLNVCRHRGAALCTGEGQLHRTLQCPYHAWTYSLSGELVAAPNLAAMPELDRAAYGLHAVALREWLGYVWVCLAPDPPSFEADVMGEVVARLGDVASIDRYDVGGLVLGRHIRYDVAANWKLIVENFMECYHCATIHPELTEVLPEFTDGFAAQYWVGHGAAFAPDAHGFTVDGRPGGPRLPGIAPDQDRRYYAITIRPQVFVNLVPDHVIVHRMTPLAADRTVVECDWLFAPGAAVSEEGVELFHRVNQQDFAACERTQPGMSSRAYRSGGVLVPSEHHIGGFHRWVTDLLA